MFLVNFLPSNGLCVENNTSTKSFSFRNTPFSEAINKICEYYDVVIYYDESLAKQYISGEYTDASLEKTLNRVLKRKNISILTNSEDNTIYIRSFGEKKQDLVASPSFYSRQKNSNTLDSYKPKTTTQLASILEQQETNKRARLNNPNYTDPMTDKTYVELASIRKKQESRKLNRLSNGDTFDPFTGKKHSDLQLISKQQEENRIKRLNDLEYIDPSTGLTMGKLNEILKIQEENKKARLGL